VDVTVLHKIRSLTFEQWIAVSQTSVCSIYGYYLFIILSPRDFWRTVY